MDSITANLHKPDKTEILFSPSIRPQRLRRPALQPAVPASARQQAHLRLPRRCPHNNHAQRRAAVPVSYRLPAPEQHLHQDRWEEKRHALQKIIVITSTFLEMRHHFFSSNQSTAVCPTSTAVPTAAALAASGSATATTTAETWAMNKSAVSVQPHHLFWKYKKHLRLRINLCLVHL